MTQKYFGLLTKIGENKQAAAQALNRIVQITHMAVGDGGGVSPIPNRDQTQLVNQRRRAPLNALEQDPNNPNYLIADQVIPEDVGGWYIREIGLYDADGDLVAVANCPETYKPLLAQGSGRAQRIRLVLMVSSTTAFELKVDPSVVLATREYVDKGLANKLDLHGTADAAAKLATGRQIAIDGGATGAGVVFDGTKDITISITGLDVSKATAGTLPVGRGGTGLSTVSTGSYLKGVGANLLGLVTPAQLLADIQALPLAGGTLTGAVTLGAGAAVGRTYGVDASSARNAHVLLPDGGGYSTNVGTIIGSFKIKLPSVAAGKNNMVRLRIDVYEYRAGAKPVTVLVHGYARSTKEWASAYATIVAGDATADLPIRFGFDADGVTPCIWLGDLTKQWAYPSISIAEVQVKYNSPGATVNGWASGWTVEPVTEFDTVNVTQLSGSFAFAQSDIAHVAGLQAALDALKPRSIANLPTQDVGPIVVIECSEVWTWVNNAYFTGYRSPLCGRPVDGHTLAPLASEVDAVGGLLNKTAYARLWGYARENNLVVTQAVWDTSKGGHLFVDVDANNFRAPDLRDMHRRYTGTNVDTTTARTLGSKQSDALQQIAGSMGFRRLNDGNSLVGNSGVSGAFGFTAGARGPSPRLVSATDASPLSDDQLTFSAAASGARTSTETRGTNVAYHPRIHI